MFEQQGPLHQQIGRIGLTGQALADQGVGLRIDRHAAGTAHAGQEIFE